MNSKMIARIQAATARREEGQGTLEYIGMIAVAALLVMAVVGAFGGGSDLAQVVTDAIADITGI